MMSFTNCIVLFFGAIIILIDCVHIIYSNGCFCPVLDKFFGRLFVAATIPVKSVDPKISSPMGKILVSLPASSKNLLLLISSENFLESHRMFIQLLNEMFDVDTKLLNRKGILMKDFGQHIYQNVVILAEKVDEFNEGNDDEVSVSNLIDLIDSGGNIMVLVGTDVGNAIRRLAMECCGIRYFSDQRNVMDFFNHYELDQEYFSKLVFYEMKPEYIVSVNNVLKNTPVLSKDLQAVLYMGTGHTLAPTNKLFPILRGMKTTMSQGHEITVIVNDLPNIVAGEDIILISGMQTNNNGRAVFSGSFNVFSDIFSQINIDNKKLAVDLIKWTFKKTGVLRLSNLKHHKIGEDVSPYVYTIRDKIKFSVDIHQLQGDYWIPYKSDDVQFDYTMIDPYVRDYLDSSEMIDSPTYSKIFQAPDKYGVFKFVVHYERLGFTTLHVESLAPLRNLKHNDYERFLLCALPYYGSSISSLIGLFIFSFLFLYHDDDDRKIDKDNVELPRMIK